MIQALVKIVDAPRMSEAMKRQVAEWLKQQADNLIAEAKDYDSTYIGKLITNEASHDDDDD